MPTRTDEAGDNDCHVESPDNGLQVGASDLEVTVRGVAQATVVKEGSVTLPAGKLLDYYVLFGPPASSRTAVYLAAARDFLVLRQPTFGFRSQDASHASQVIIIGELQDVDQTTEDALVAANCLVTRLQGSPAEVRAALDDLESIQF